MRVCYLTQTRSRPNYRGPWSWVTGRKFCRSQNFGAPKIFLQAHNFVKRFCRGAIALSDLEVHNFWYGLANQNSNSKFLSFSCFASMKSKIIQVQNLSLKISSFETSLPKIIHWKYPSTNRFMNQLSKPFTGNTLLPLYEHPSPNRFMNELSKPFTGNTYPLTPP